MQFTKLLVVFAVIIEKVNPSSIIIEPTKTEGFADFGESAIRILNDCYAKQNNTIAFIGDYPEDFIRRLMSQQSFSFVLLDDRKRAENLNNHFLQVDQYRKHKVHVAVMIAPSIYRSFKSIKTFVQSIYDNPLASTLILGWSSTKQTIGCDLILNIADIFDVFNLNNMFNANLLCQDDKKGILMFGSNPFTNQAPVPWVFVKCLDDPKQQCLSLFVREFRDQKEMCDNLNFDKTKNLNGWPIQTTHAFHGSHAPLSSPHPKYIPSRSVRIQGHKRCDFIYNFITYVNATQYSAWKRIVEGEPYSYVENTMDDRPFVAREVVAWPSFTYTHARDCLFLVTKFRGNKTQLEKLYAVIDHYSWLGMYIVYLITLLFFKFFLRQPLIIGCMNLCRLTCNCGLPTIPSNSPSRIYMGCLLFFVVTMQGIFTGNLASLLTHDVPVRQMNSLQDLTDLRYAVYADQMNLIFFDDAVSNGRFRMKKPNEPCIEHVKTDDRAACAISGAFWKQRALEAGLHISTDCITIDYLHNRVPWRWALLERLNMFILRTIATETVMPLDAIVDEKRMLEAESQEIPLEPRVMILDHLGFAFRILVIGLVFASCTLIVEIIIHRFHRRITTTKVIFL